MGVVILAIHGRVSDESRERQSSILPVGASRRPEEWRWHCGSGHRSWPKSDWLSWRVAPAGRIRLSMVNDNGRGPQRCDVGSPFSLTASSVIVLVMGEEFSGDDQHEHSHGRNTCLGTATLSLH